MPDGERPSIAWPTIVVGTGSVYHLHPPGFDDVDRLHTLFSDPEVTRHIPAPPSSAAAWSALISRTRREAGTTHVAFAVLERGADREMVGLVQIALVPDEPTAWMWGVVLAERVWGTGLFAAVADAILNVARNQLHASVLKAWIAVANDRAIKAFQKLPGVKLVRLEDAPCPDGRHGDFVVASVRFRTGRLNQRGWRFDCPLGPAST